MSEELSRVRSRQKQYKGGGQSPVKEKNGNSTSDAVAGPPDAPVVAPGILSRKVRHAGQQAQKKPKHEAEQQEGEATPSRAQSYPSERIRFSKMFINSLIVIFIMLLAFLLFWGIKGAPPLRELWQ
ncbi:hypothetical protein [Paenibacillus borealis]|uniref:hypothetical protein n=1 Tax=Paenibacillus borealis TaxID=160799 RepID=UPI0005A684C0|nr:hypothetical protein [Paenibacillus borealis]